MFRHALKLVWNRRRANATVILEIGAAFVVSFVLLALSVHFWSSYRQPLGFSYQDVWGGTLRASDGLDARRGEVRRTLGDVLAAIRGLPNVEAVHVMQETPFTPGTMSWPLGADAESAIETSQSAMTTGAPEALGLRLVAGRWFGVEDEGATYRAALVNRRFVEDTFRPGLSPLGKNVNYPPEWLLEATERYSDDARREVGREIRVVGVIDHFRQHGEFSDEPAHAIVQYDAERTLDGELGELAIKVRPNTVAAFEERIIESVEAIAPDWTATITPWEQRRETMHAQTLMPLRVGAILGAFLLVMVALGLLGVLWQDVVRRTQEIGLRRAVGASAAGVRRQIVLEMLIVGSFGILAGTAIAVQFPLLAFIEQIDWSSALPGMGLAAILVLALVSLSALYPSWLASRREPADALRYE